MGESSAEGPAYTLGPKPDLSAPGTARIGSEFVAGTSVAAARTAATAAKLAARKTAAEPRELAARLLHSAQPRGPLLEGGAGEPRLEQAAALETVIEPATVALPRQPAGARFTARREVTLRNVGRETVEATAAVSLPGAMASVEPSRTRLGPGEEARLTVSAESEGSGSPPGYLTGTLRVHGATAPIGLAIGLPPPAPLSELTLVTKGERTTGVRFTAGAVRQAGDAREVQPLGELELEVVDANGIVVRRLTPPGGARDVLPGEYAYTLTRAAMEALDAGPFRFRATARGPAGGSAVVRTSPEFGGK